MVKYSISPSFYNIVKLSQIEKIQKENSNSNILVVRDYKFEEWHITSIVYQKFKHVLGCSFPLNPGDKRDVVAELASASSHPAIAKFLSAFPAWSRIMKHIRCFWVNTRNFVA